MTEEKPLPCALGSMAKDLLAVGMWIYFWALHSVPLTYISAFFFKCQYHIVLITIALKYVLKSDGVISAALIFPHKIAMTVVVLCDSIVLSIKKRSLLFWQRLH